MTSSVRQLIEAARLEPVAAPFDWTRVENEIGAAVPGDYRELLDAGGGGLWLDYVRLNVPGPGAGFAHVDLEQAALEFEQLRFLFEEDITGAPGDLGPGDRLLPWASTGTGLTLYWQVPPEAGVGAETEVGTGAEVGAYPIRISDREGEVWERYELPTTDFLLGIVRGKGEIKSGLLRESWMKRDVLFKPYG